MGDRKSAKISVETCRKLHLTVDRSCYPWIGYKGPRFAPTEVRKVWTDEEYDLYKHIRVVQQDARNRIKKFENRHKDMAMMIGRLCYKLKGYGNPSDHKLMASALDLLKRFNLNPDPLREVLVKNDGNL